MHTGIWLGDLMERDDFEGLGIDRNMWPEKKKDE
jgi:hypothetical protein